MSTDGPDCFQIVRRRVEGREPESGSVDEEPRGIIFVNVVVLVRRVTQRGDAVGELAIHLQQLAAGRQHPEARARG